MFYVQLRALLCAYLFALVAYADIRGDLENLLHSQTTQSSNDASFRAQKITFSQGRRAICASGIARVPINSQNIKFTTQVPPNPMAATELAQEVLQADATIIQNSIAGTQAVKGTYDISANLCYPLKLSSILHVKTMQVLTHGTGLQKNYWDLAAPNNSYVDAAADAGYATLAYDRLGVGQSERPDPIQVVQAQAHIEVLEGLIQGVRKGTVGPQKFDNVVCVGHSYGQVIQTGHDLSYPGSCSAVLATGISDTLQYLPGASQALNPTLANQAEPQRFGQLSNAFFEYPTTVSTQLPFFRYPYFDQKVFDVVFNTRDTYTIGDLFTLPSVFKPAPAFTGPVDVVVGQYDIVFCGGDCGDRLAAYKSTFYPGAVKSSTLKIPNTGHVINGHNTAADAFKQMLDFLKQNNL